MPSTHSTLSPFSLSGVSLLESLVTHLCQAGKGPAFATTKALRFPPNLPPPHAPQFSGVLKEKAFCKGVIFMKESNHLSLCIIACGRDISLLGSCPPAHPPACGSRILPELTAASQAAAGAAAFREPSLRSIR